MASHFIGGVPPSFMKTQTLILEGQLPAINEIIANSKTHWANYSRVKRGNTNLIALQCKTQRLKTFEHPVGIVFNHYRPNKRKDPDNVAGGAMKVILDGLVKAGILKDDTMDFVKCLHHTFNIDKVNPRIEVVFYESGNK